MTFHFHNIAFELPLGNQEQRARLGIQNYKNLSFNLGIIPDSQNNHFETSRNQRKRVKEVTSKELHHVLQLMNLTQAQCTDIAGLPM